MTVGIAARYDGGVLLASDSLVAAGDQRIYLPHIKAYPYNVHCWVMYAGALSTIDRFRQRELPAGNIASAMQESLFTTPLPKKERGQFELVVVAYGDIHILDGDGALIPQDNFAVAGSALAWVGLDLEYPKLRNRTMGATKAMLARVLRSVCKRDSTCDGPLFYQAVE